MSRLCGFVLPWDAMFQHHVYKTLCRAKFWETAKNHINDPSSTSFLCIHLLYCKLMRRLLLFESIILKCNLTWTLLLSQWLITKSFTHQLLHSFFPLLVPVSQCFQKSKKNFHHNILLPFHPDTFTPNVKSMWWQRDPVLNHSSPIPIWYSWLTGSISLPSSKLSFHPTITHWKHLVAYVMCGPWRQPDYWTWMIGDDRDMILLGFVLFPFAWLGLCCD